MQLFGLRSCDSCRKARKALQAAGHEVMFTDLRDKPLEKSDFERFYSVLGDSLLNRRSTTWRSLGAEEKTTDPVALLVAYPTLMKRPVIENNGTLYLGWNTDVEAALLGK